MRRILGDNFWTIGGTIVPCLIILIYCLPIIHLGADSLSMIRYFDMDESSLVEFGVRLYQQGVLPIETACGYPKFFNYLSGLFLYPYTWLFGASAKVVAITYRSVNVAAMVATAVVINLIGIRFFGSYLVGFVSSLLFSLTPAFLWWGLNSRPHPLEIFFIAMAVYCCLSAIEIRQTKRLWMAVFWAGLATGTKLAGIFLIPTIVLIYAHLLWTENPDGERLKPEGRQGNAIAIITLGTACAVLWFVHYTLFSVARSATGITVAQELGWQQGLLSWPFNIGVLTGALLLFLGVVVFLLNRKTIDIYRKIHTVSDHRADGQLRPFLYLFGHKLIIFSAKVSLALSLIFLLTNFDFLISPLQNTFGILRMFFMTVQGTDLQRDPSYLTWLTWFTRHFHTARCMGIGGVLIVLFYLAVELLQIRSGISDTGLGRRLLLLSYPVVLVGFLVVGVQHRASHYLLPVFMVLFVLGVDALVRMMHRIENIYRLRIYQVLCVAVILLGIAERLPELRSSRTLVEARSRDPVVTQLAPWLSSSYAPSIKIMSDDVSMYIPDTFTELFYWRATMRKWGNAPGLPLEIYRPLSEVEPDVFVRSNFSRLDTTWVLYKRELAYLDENYSIVRQMSDNTAARISYPKDRIIVYERKRNPISKAGEITNFERKIKGESHESGYSLRRQGHAPARRDGIPSQTDG